MTHLIAGQWSHTAGPMHDHCSCCHLRGAIPARLVTRRSAQLRARALRGGRSRVRDVAGGRDGARALRHSLDHPLVHGPKERVVRGKVLGLAGHVRPRRSVRVAVRHLLGRDGTPTHEERHGDQPLDALLGPAVKLLPHVEARTAHWLAVARAPVQDLLHLHLLPILDLFDGLVLLPADEHMVHPVFMLACCLHSHYVAGVLALHLLHDPPNRILVRRIPAIDSEERLAVASLL
mmetsp:Transcript_35341/g.89476  ORF Transcript_35341/g.89476 Transcript_35341/m.89476 type:complete len:234 (-) Transcript_35341:189-890(-)